MKKNQVILKFNTFDEVFGKLLRSNKYRDIFDVRLARLRLIRQIRELRRSKKLTQKSFATRVGMPQSVIARLETGRHNFSLNTLYQIAGAFGKQVKLV
ncbi:MAG: helix-turn-helix transcriptional regulator [Candidatus Paceibacterota bacterium]|jgi:DNA-binding XRE family transcriptional regulator